MKKKTHDHLAKIFAAEIEGRMFQVRGKPKWIQALLEGGLIEPCSLRFGNVLCEGYCLSVSGHYEFCRNCK